MAAAAPHAAAGTVGTVGTTRASGRWWQTHATRRRSRANAEARLTTLTTTPRRRRSDVSPVKAWSPDATTTRLYRAATWSGSQAHNSALSAPFSPWATFTRHPGHASAAANARAALLALQA